MPTIRSPFLKKSDPYIYRDHHTPCRMPGRDDYILKPARLEGRRRSESPGHIAATCEADAAHNMRRQPKYTASQKKTRHSICGRNFVRCKPIFTILSLTDSQENSLRVRPARCCSSMHIGCRRDTTRMGVNATGTSGGVAGRAPKTRESRRRRRRGGSGEGLCPFPENLRIFHLKMV